MKSSSLNLNVVEDSGSKYDTLDDDDKSTYDGMVDVNEDESMALV